MLDPIIKFKMPYVTGSYPEIFRTLRKDLISKVPIYLFMNSSREPERISKFRSGRYEDYVHIGGDISLSYPYSELFKKLRVKDIYGRYRPFIYSQSTPAGKPTASIYAYPEGILVLTYHPEKIQQGDFILGDTLDQVTPILSTHSTIQEDTPPLGLIFDTPTEKGISLSKETSVILQYIKTC